MDVFKAYTEFSGPGRHVLGLKKGDSVEILEPAASRHRREWWAARRLRDNAIGYVPSKYLEFDESIAAEFLPPDFQQQRELHLHQLEMMEKDSDHFPEENNNKYGALRRGKGGKQRQPLLQQQRGEVSRLPRTSLIPPTTIPLEDVCLGSRASPTASREDLAQLDLRNSLIVPLRDSLSPHSSPRSSSPFVYSSPRNSPLPREENWETDPKHYKTDDFEGHAACDSQGQATNDLSREEWLEIITAADVNFVEPEPDYTDDDLSGDRSNGSPSFMIQPHPNAHLLQGMDTELLAPKKLQNPCLVSRERQALHKELLMNNRLGVDVLNKKSELRKALDKRTEERKKKEQEEYLKSKRTVFEKKLEEQAVKMKPYEVDNTRNEKSQGGTAAQEKGAPWQDKKVVVSQDKKGAVSLDMPAAVSVASSGISTPDKEVPSPKKSFKQAVAKNPNQHSKPQTPDDNVPEFLRVYTKINKNKLPTS